MSASNTASSRHVESPGRMPPYSELGTRLNSAHTPDNLGRELLGVVPIVCHIHCVSATPRCAHQMTAFDKHQCGSQGVKRHCRILHALQIGDGTPPCIGRYVT